MSYGNMLHIPPTSHYLLAAKKSHTKKPFILTKNREEFRAGGEREDQENGPVGRKKDKKKRAMAVGRRTREETVK